MLRAPGTNSAATAAQIHHHLGRPRTETKRLHLPTLISHRRIDLTIAALAPNTTRCATQDLPAATQTALKLSVIPNKARETYHYLHVRKILKDKQSNLKVKY